MMVVFFIAVDKESSNVKREQQCVRIKHAVMVALKCHTYTIDAIIMHKLDLRFY